MKRERTLFIALLVLLAVTPMLFAGATKYDDGTASAAVTFGAQIGERAVKSVYVTTDKVGGTVKLYAATGARRAPTASPTNGSTVVYITNTGTAIDSGDHVVYQHANGTLDKTTVSSATTTNITLAAGISSAGATGDYVYEVAQSAQLDFDTAGAAVGTNKYGSFSGDAVAVVPSGSPLYCVVDGTSNTVINVTVK